MINNVTNIEDEVNPQLNEAGLVNSDTKPWLQYLLDDAFGIFEGYDSVEDEPQ